MAIGGRATAGRPYERRMKGNPAEGLAAQIAQNSKTVEEPVDSGGKGFYGGAGGGELFFTIDLLSAMLYTNLVIFDC